MRKLIGGHNHIALFLAERLHGREQEHVSDGIGVGQEHHEAVEAEAQAARRGACHEGLSAPRKGDFSG